MANNTGAEIHYFTYSSPDSDETIEERLITGCPLTDTGNAERLITYHGAEIRYCADRKQWYIWNGARWIPDVKGAIFEMAKETVIKIHDEIKYIDVGDKAARKELSKFAYKSESQKSLRDMIANAQTDARIAMTSDAFDANLSLMNFPNGTLDKDKCEFREHRREDLLTMMTDAPLNPCVGSAHFFPTLIKALPLDEALYTQLLLGSCLEATTQNKEWLFVYGKPFAMKSSVTQPVYKALGDYAKKFPIELFIKGKQRIASNAARPELMALRGARIAWSEEAPPNFVIDETILKGLTSSGIESTRGLYESQTELNLVCSFIVESNGTFTFDIDDEWSRDAALQRTRVLKFVNALPPEKRDGEILKRLTRDKDELTAALAWVFTGYFLHKEYGITTPETVKAANDEFEAIINPLSSFVKDELEFGDGYVSIKELYARFCDVSSKEKIKQFPNERSFNIQLRKILPYFASKEGVIVEAKKVDKVLSWLNISLKDEEAELLENGDDGTSSKAKEGREPIEPQNSVFTQNTFHVKNYMEGLYKLGVLRLPPIYPKGSIPSEGLEPETDAAESLEIGATKFEENSEHGEDQQDLENEVNVEPLSHNPGHVKEQAETVSETNKVKQAEFNLFILKTLGALRSSQTAFEPEVLCGETVQQYCTDHNINGDRKTRLVLGKRFAEFVDNGEAAHLFLKLTGGKPLILGGM